MKLLLWIKCRTDCEGVGRWFAHLLCSGDSSAVCIWVRPSAGTPRRRGAAGRRLYDRNIYPPGRAWRRVGGGRVQGARPIYMHKRFSGWKHIMHTIMHHTHATGPHQSSSHATTRHSHHLSPLFPCSLRPPTSPTAHINQRGKAAMSENSATTVAAPISPALYVCVCVRVCVRRAEMTPGSPRCALRTACMLPRLSDVTSNKKLSYRWQTARRI